jgi:hypothetical protein
VPGLDPFLGFSEQQGIPADDGGSDAPCCCEAVDITPYPLEEVVPYGVGRTGTLTLEPVVNVKRAQGGSCKLTWEEKRNSWWGTSYGKRIPPDTWADVSDDPRFTMGVGREALADLKNPCSTAILPLVDHPGGGPGYVLHIRITLTSGCPGGKSVVRVIKFWVDDVEPLAHIEVVPGAR